MWRIEPHHHPAPALPQGRLMFSEAHTIGKRAVRILLESFLAETIFMQAFVLQHEAQQSSNTVQVRNG